MKDKLNTSVSIADVCVTDYGPRIDWEQRRYELAKSAMQGLLCAPIVEGVDPNPTPWELKELKKGE